MGRRALPARAVAAMRDAFAAEVATRVPGMQSAAAEMLATGALTAARQLRTHVHTLASSAAILGERAASAHARACELLVGTWCDGEANGDGAGGIPRQVAVEVAGEVETISLLLSSWLAVPGTS